MQNSEEQPPEDLYHFAFDLAPVGLAVTKERIILRCNARFCETFAFTASELEGKLLSHLYPSNKEFLDIGRHGRNHMKTDGRYNDERIMKRAGGELFWCRVRGQAQNPERPFAQCVWSFVDLSDTRPIVQLSRRERQVAMLLSKGMTTKEIARNLSLSPRTIEVYRAKLFQKFNVKNALELLSTISGLPS